MLFGQFGLWQIGSGGAREIGLGFEDARGITLGHASSRGYILGLRHWNYQFGIKGR